MPTLPHPACSTYGPPPRPPFQANGETDAIKSVDFVVFLVVYFVYTIVCLILLLNLLIAMMGSTFGQITLDSTLQWRANFARMILRL